MLTFTGNAPVGQYFIYLMVEDRIHVPSGRPASTGSPLSAVPLHLSVTGGSTNQQMQFLSFPLFWLQSQCSPVLGSPSGGVRGRLW